MKPGTSTRSSGPSPTTWYAMLTSALLAYRVSGGTNGIEPPVTATRVDVRDLHGMSSLLDSLHGHNGDREAPPHRGRVGRDRRVAGGALALLGRGGRPGREGGRRRNAPRGRRGRRRDGGAAPGAQARRDPRARGWRARPPTRRGGSVDLGRGGQADESRPRRGKPCDVDVYVLRGRGTEARRRDGPDGRVPGGRRQARVHASPPPRRGRRDQPVQLPAQSRRPQDRPVA